MKTSLPALLFALAVAMPVAAHEGEGKGEAGASQDPGPCKKDAEKLCPGLQPGDGKFGRCIEEHMDDVSDACRDRMKEMKGKMKDKMGAKADACKEEAAKACPGMHPGDGKFGPCMKEHKDDLSEGCKRFMKRMADGSKKKGETGGDGKSAAKDVLSKPGESAEGDKGE